MKVYVTKESAPEVIKIALKAFPEYNGKKFSVQVFSGPMRLDSYWSGGSKNTWRVVAMSDAPLVASVPENGGHPMQFGGNIAQLSELPPGFALVRHCLFCGKDLGLDVYVAPDSMNSMALPEAKKLTDLQTAVLVITAGLKSFARRESAEEHGITPEMWEQGKKELIAMGLLQKNGAVTPEGRNTRGDLMEYNLPKLKPQQQKEEPTCTPVN
jgi:hypothetical protein